MLGWVIHYIHPEEELLHFTQIWYKIFTQEVQGLFSAQTIVLTVIYNQQFQGTILLLAFDFQGIYIYISIYILKIYDQKFQDFWDRSPRNGVLFASAFEGTEKAASKRAARRTCCTKTKFDAQSENCLELSSYPGYQSAPGLFQFLVGNFETQPSFVTGISGDFKFVFKDPSKIDWLSHCTTVFRKRAVVFFTICFCNLLN